MALEIRQKKCPGKTGTAGSRLIQETCEVAPLAVPDAGALAFDPVQHVTDKAMDCLFFMVAGKEEKIRRYPVA